MDIYKIKDTLSTKRFRDIFCGVLVVLFITAEMFISATSSWNRALDIINLTGIISWVVFIIICVRYFHSKSFAVKIYGAFLVWLIVTRPFCKDITLGVSHDVILMQLLFFCLLTFSSSIDRAHRKKLFTVVSIVYCTFCLIIAAACIYTAVTHNDVDLPMGIRVRLMGGYGVFTNVLNRNKNDTAQWISVAFCLSLCQFALVNEKRRAKYAVLVVSLVYYIAIGTIHSRASMIATALIFAMFVSSLVFRILKRKTNGMRIVMAVAVVLIALPVFYKTFSLTDYAINSLHVYASTKETDEMQTPDAVYRELKTEILYEEKNLSDAIDKSGNEMLLTDNRDKEDIISLTGRTTIWKAALGTIIYEPQRLICGSLVNDYMTSINIKLPILGYNKKSAVDTHNFLLEIIMLTGLPGFMLMLAFVVLLVVRMIKVFFFNEADLLQKILTLPLTAKLVIGMCEATLVKTENVTNYIFFLVAGIFLSYSYELFPEKKHWGRRKGTVQSANDGSSTAIDENTAEQTLPEQVTL